MIDLGVYYYNDEHESKLKSHKHHQKIEQIIKNGLSVTEEEFVTYSIFREQKGYRGWRNYQELKMHLPDRLAGFRDYFDISQGTLRAKYPSEDSDKYQTESAGVATSLVLMNRVYGLHEADWERIPTGTTKALDFKIASDGHEFIEVESKGIVFDDLDLTKSRTHEARKSIEQKKQEQRAGGHSNTSYFGVIAGIPFASNMGAKCLLLDPERNARSEDPQKYQLLARLYFYLNNLRLVSLSHVVTALINRIKILESTERYPEFDGLPLVDVYGNKMQTPPMAIYNKTAMGADIAGNVFPVNRTQFFFYGFDLDVYRLIVEQDFGEIRTFRSKLAKGTSETAEVRARVNLEDLKRLNVYPMKLEKIPRTNEAFVELGGKSYVSDSGRVTGFLSSK